MVEESSCFRCLLYSPHWPASEGASILDWSIDLPPGLQQSSQDLKVQGGRRNPIDHKKPYSLSMYLVGCRIHSNVVAGSHEEWLRERFETLEETAQIDRRSLEEKDDSVIECLIQVGKW